MNSLKIRESQFNWGERTYIMGILNVTPDSFSDGGQFDTIETAFCQAKQLIAEGADIVDIGGQSSRPGAQIIPLEEELKRIIPIIKVIRQESQIPLSIDTTRARVATEAIAVGADIVNDVSGGTDDEQMLPQVGQLGVPMILMHRRGTAQTMQSLTDYGDLLGEIKDFLFKQMSQAQNAGISAEKLIIDPGIGFAKNYEQNIQILQQLREFQTLNCPILVGVSRKSFIGHILQQSDPKKRIWGTAAAHCLAIAQGADILRVHDVAVMKEVSQVADVLWRKD
ncbi:MAG: dihydropteroate synthase [Microcystaceae cyanobacterium]